MKLPTNFCIAPFIQHTTHPSGSCSPCPYLGGTTWPPTDANILHQWTDDRLEQLRQDFWDNKQNPICDRCWHEEDNGKRSLRQRFFDPVKETSGYDEFKNFDVVYQRLEDKKYLTGPLILAIKNGNICNARCRSCHPVDSSRWFSDAKKIVEATGYQYYDFKVRGKEETNWDDGQLDEIMQLSQNLVRLELFGGESAYNKQVRRLLERLVETGIAKNLTLYVNTNGGIDLVEEWPFMREFKTLEIKVSVDGIFDQFDYIRHGLDYENVKANIKKLHQYGKAHNLNLYISAICTVSTLNIFYLLEINKELKNVFNHPTYYNLLIEPEYLFIKNMPDSVKQAVNNKMGFNPWFANLLSVMNQAADLREWDRFLEVTRLLDRVRGEDFVRTFPEFAEIIDY
jgi:MoaA/NifB/PqqE/SkfB family radical SAM enzyme